MKTRLTLSQINKIVSNSNRFNGADATGVDTSTDSSAVEINPDDYLTPRIDTIHQIQQYLILIVLVLSIVVLVPMAIKNLKSI